MTKHRHAPTRTPTVALLLAIAGCAQGAPETAAEASPLSAMEDGPPPGHRPPGPPPEAIAACAGKAAGDACTVELPDRQIEGTCTAPPEGAPDDTLFCLPEGAPPPPPHRGGRRGGHHGPPPEALAACEGVAVGEACTVLLDDRTIEGTCLTPPWNDAAAACVPPHGPRDRGE